MSPYTDRCAGVFLLLAILGGCSGTPVDPSPTTDQVLAAQYRAGGHHGSISGDEATRATNAYRQHIGATPDAAASRPTAH